MAISFANLHFADPSPEARRLLWHVLSIGSVSRDEPERHEGLDKAGLFLFQVVAGKGQLEMLEKRHYTSFSSGRAWISLDACWAIGG